MKYVLKQSYNSDRSYYVYSNTLIHDKLCRAIIFDTIFELETFRKLHSWMATYLIIEITEADLFKARLSDA